MQVRFAAPIYKPGLLAAAHNEVLIRITYCSFYPESVGDHRHIVSLILLIRCCEVWLAQSPLKHWRGVVWMRNIVRGLDSSNLHEAVLF